MRFSANVCVWICWRLWELLWEWNGLPWEHFVENQCGSRTQPLSSVFEFAQFYGRIAQFAWIEMPNKGTIVEICINETVYGGLYFL